MENQELVQLSDGAELRLSRSPETLLTEAAIVGKAIDRLVKQKPDLVQVISGRRHPRFELLQIVAQMFRLTARVRETRHIQSDGIDGWECTAEAFHIPTQSVVSVADSQCTNDEPSWAVRTKYGKGNEPDSEIAVPSFQRRSMAQTRACGKALRLAIGFVLGMAGYQETPAEEITGSEYDKHGAAPAPPSPPQRRSQSQPDPAPAPQTYAAPADNGEPKISEAQAKRMYAIAVNEAGLSRESFDRFLKVFGFTHTREIPKNRYDELCTELQKGDER